MRCAQTLEVGAYVLGALSPAERDAFERHLGTCAFCRAEVADLAVLPGLLGRLDVETALAVARDGEEYSALPADIDQELAAWGGPTAPAWGGPTGAGNPSVHGQAGAQPVPGQAGVQPVAGQAGVQPVAGQAGAPAARPVDADEVDADRSGTVVSLLAAAGRRRATEQRRRRLMTVVTGVAAACLAVAVGLGASMLTRDDRPGAATPTLAAMKQVVAAVPVTASLALEPVTAGTRVTMRCEYHGSGSGRWPYKLVAIPKSGGPGEELAVWSAGNGDEYQTRSLAHMRPSEIDRVEIQKLDGTPLLVYRP